MTLFIRHNESMNRLKNVNRIRSKKDNKTNTSSKNNKVKYSPVAKLDAYLLRGNINALFKYVLSNLTYSINYLSGVTGIEYETLIKLKDGYYYYFEYEDVEKFLEFVACQYGINYSGDVTDYPIYILEYTEQEEYRRAEREFYYSKYKKMRSTETTKTQGKGKTNKNGLDKPVIRIDKVTGAEAEYKSIGEVYRENTDIIKSLEALHKKFNRDLKTNDQIQYKGYYWRFKTE